MLSANQKTTQGKQALAMISAHSQRKYEENLQNYDRKLIMFKFGKYLTQIE